MTIREATPADAGEISKLMDELGYPISSEDVEKNLTEYNAPRGFVWVARKPSTTVGFVSFWTMSYFHAVGMSGRITAMCVRSDYRRSGIGKKLIQQVETCARTLNCEKIEITSGQHRKNEAHRFYQALGYEPASSRFVKKL